MKKILYIALLLTMAACTTESDDNLNMHTTANHKSLAVSDSEASNPLNPYDLAGSNYLVLSDAFAAIEKPQANPAIVDTLYSIALQMGWITSAHDRLSASEIMNMADLAESDLTSALSALDISPQAKTYLRDMVSSLTLLKQDNATYSDAYSQLVAIEAAVYGSTLPAGDKQVLLSTMSIVRYDAYGKSRRKRKDRDWELSVGNIMATALGAMDSTIDAAVGGAASDYMN